MDNLEGKIRQLESDYEKLKQLCHDMAAIAREIESRQEVSELYYYSMKVRKRCVEEILEDACIQEFGTTISEFRGSWMQPSSKRGVKRTSKIWGTPGNNEAKKNVVDAQHWFISIMQNILHRNSNSMKINYPFFDVKKVTRHRPIFLSALNPNPEDSEQMKYRAIYLSIMERTRSMMKNEHVFEESLEI